MTVPLAFTAIQQALAAIHFESSLGQQPARTLSDPGNCLPPAITSRSVMDSFVRHLKCVLCELSFTTGSAHLSHCSYPWSNLQGC